jgi:hypothetical protein
MSNTDFDRETSLRTRLQNIGLWLALIGAVLIFVFVILYSDQATVKIKTIDELAKEIGFALLIAGLIIITAETKSRTEFKKLFEEQIHRFNSEMNGRLLEFDQQIQRFNDEMNRRLLEFYGTVSVTRVPEEIQRSDNREIKLIGSRVYERYLRGLRAIPGGLQIDDRNWILESNRIFYECLNESNCKDGEVRITHTGAIDTWQKSKAARRRTLEQQQRLTQKNMKIIRIFIGEKPLAESPDYREVMEFMSNEYGITCKYVQHDSPSSITDMTWVPQLNLLSVWKPGVGAEVESVDIIPDHLPGLDLNVEWSSLLRDAKERGAAERSQT